MLSPHRSLSEIDFDHLRTFLALAQFENFSRTGERVGLSQSAVSRHIRALEDALGVRLFERLGRRAVLTSAGQKLRSRLEILMREAESLPRLVKDLAEGVQGDVRIGATITAANAILPAWLGHYRLKYPKVELNLQPGSSERMLEALARGEVDLAFVGSERQASGTTVVAEIPDEVVLIASNTHQFVRRRLKSTDLAGCDFIQREAASDTRALVSLWFQSQGVQLRNLMGVW